MHKNVHECRLPADIYSSEALLQNLFFYFSNSLNKIPSSKEIGWATPWIFHLQTKFYLHFLRNICIHVSQLLFYILLPSKKNSFSWLLAICLFCLHWSQQNLNTTWAKLLLLYWLHDVCLRFTHSLSSFFSLGKGTGKVICRWFAIALCSLTALGPHWSD